MNQYHYDYSEIHQVVFGLGYILVIVSKSPLIDVQSPAVIKLNLLIFSLILTEKSQIIQLLSYVWMLTSQHLSIMGKTYE